MRTAHRRRTGTGIAIIILLLIVISSVVLIAKLSAKPEEELPPEPEDPHKGQVYIDDGFGMVWITPWKDVAVNDLSRSDVSVSGDIAHYHGSAYETQLGVDVSEHQHTVDWEKIAAAGIDFAMIRIGYRGCTEGGLYEDPFFRFNMEGARKNGLKIGVYFYSQALNVQEAIEEAEYTLNRLQGYSIDLPIVYDWEVVENEENVRTDGMDRSVLTDCAVAYCQTIANAGFDACVYFNRHFGYYEYDLSRLNAYQFWLALPGDYPDFYYKTDIWQYSFTAEVPGIEGPTDMSIRFIPLAGEETPKVGEGMQTVVTYARSPDP